MDLTEPASALAPGLTIPLLRALDSRGTPATVEQLRRAAGAGTAAGARGALDRLARHGLLRVARIGERASTYELERDHLLYPVVRGLLEAASALPTRLATAVAAWSVPPESASLFGSAARRDGSVDSDVDLLVARMDDLNENDAAAWVEQIHELRHQVHSWTGNLLQVLDRTVEELSALAAAGEPIVTEWRRDAVTIYGQSLRGLLEDAR